MAATRFKNLFGYSTYHMEAYARLVLAIHPNFVKWDNQEQAEQFIALRKQAEHLTRGEMLSAAELAFRRDPQFLAEKEADLIDVSNANETRMKKFEGADLKQS